MRTHAMLLIVGLVAAVWLSGCGDKPGTPANEGSASRRSAAMREASTYDPDTDAAVVKALQNPALKDDPEYSRFYKEPPATPPEGTPGEPAAPAEPTTSTEPAEPAATPAEPTTPAEPADSPTDETPADTTTTGDTTDDGGGE